MEVLYIMLCRSTVECPLEIEKPLTLKQHTHTHTRGRHALKEKMCRHSSYDYTAAGEREAGSVQQVPAGTKASLNRSSTRTGYRGKRVFRE